VQENQQVYGESQGILDSLNSAFTPILEAGPNQPGFSQAEDTALNTEAEDSTATNYANAEKTLQENQAAEGGGNLFEPSGAAQSERAGVAEKAAGTLSGEQNQITQQNYATGRQNFMNAAGVLSGEQSTLNPNGTAEAATGASSAASSTANTIASQSNSVWTSVLGALGGIAGQAAGGLTKQPGSSVPAFPLSMYADL
jgi:hypothetical protein